MTAPKTPKIPTNKELLMTNVSQQALVIELLQAILAGKAKPSGKGRPAPTGAASPVITQ